MQIENHFIDIIRKEMGLPQNNIWLWSQDKKIPAESTELYVVVGCLDFEPISSKSYFVGTDANKKERQVVYGEALLQIDIFSRSTEARTRRAEILMALNSFYSQEVQNKYNFRIFEIPVSFLNNSKLEGGSSTNRFTIRVRAMCTEVKEKGTDYYDTFNAEINSDGTIIAMDDLQNNPDLQTSS